MNKIFLIIRREFLSRVTKRSFLIATFLVPLLFPTVIGGLAYYAVKEKENAAPKSFMVVNKSEGLTLESNDRYKITPADEPLSQALTIFRASHHDGLLYIPELDIDSPEGLVLYTKSTPGPVVVSGIESMLAQRIKDLKLVKYAIDKATIEKLQTSVVLDTRITAGDSEKAGRSGLASVVGYATGFLIYLFLFVYGGQVMQGVIEEKNSKIVEVIVSTVKPFHFMLGKVVGVATVGLLQIMIWLLLMGGIYLGAGSYFGLAEAQKVQMEQLARSTGSDEAAIKRITDNSKIKKALEEIKNFPVATTVMAFIIYFIGGYLLYGALFAAIGSAVDTPADAQQFMLPIMLPIVVGFIGMSMFVFDDPNGTMSFWLSVIPFTSPIVMMGRIGFGVPAGELILSVVLLAASFVLTIWLAGRIYRVGILMHGTKVNYRVLVRWFITGN